MTTKNAEIENTTNWFVLRSIPMPGMKCNSKTTITTGSVERNDSFNLINERKNILQYYRQKSKVHATAHALFNFGHNFIYGIVFRILLASEL